MKFATAILHASPFLHDSNFESIKQHHAQQQQKLPPSTNTVAAYSPPLVNYQKDLLSKFSCRILPLKQITFYSAAELFQL
jgi:hypothetical protein